MIEIIDKGNTVTRLTVRGSGSATIKLGPGVSEDSEVVRALTDLALRLLAESPEKTLRGQINDVSRREAWGIFLFNDRRTENRVFRWSKGSWTECK